MKQEYNVSVKPNKSMTYMFPFVNEQLDLKFDILNSYVAFDKESNVFCILVKWSSDTLFIKQEEELFKHHLFLGHVDLGNHTVYKIKLTRRMKEGVELFKKGEYTKFDKEHKNVIMTYLTRIGATNSHRIREILDPDGDLVSAPPTLENETLMNHVKIISFKPRNFVD